MLEGRAIEFMWRRGWSYSGHLKCALNPSRNGYRRVHGLSLLQIELNMMNKPVTTKAAAEKVVSH
jgi:hypothetical protein